MCSWSPCLCNLAPLSTGNYHYTHFATDTLYFLIFNKFFPLKRINKVTLKLFTIETAAHCWGALPASSLSDTQGAAGEKSDQTATHTFNSQFEQAWKQTMPDSFTTELMLFDKGYIAPCAARLFVKPSSVSDTPTFCVGGA